jgi:hypothetical protein
MDEILFEGLKIKKLLFEGQVFVSFQVANFQSIGILCFCPNIDIDYCG